VAAPVNYYVDPSLGSDTGDGTIGTPWGRASGSVVQYALNTITRNATNGDQINVKAGTDDTLTAALSLATYGTPTTATPLVIRGYTSALADGGQGGITCGGSNIKIVNGSSNMTFIDMHLHSCGNQRIIEGAGEINCIRCELNNTSSDGIVATSGHLVVVECYLYDIGGIGIYAFPAAARALISHNYLQDSTKKFAAAIYSAADGVIAFNIISKSGASNGIRVDGSYTKVFSNSLLNTAAAATTYGILIDGNYIIDGLYNNIVEGWSNTSGVGIRTVSVTTLNGRYVAHNAAFNNTTNFSLGGEELFTLDNESLGSTAFAKSGSDTFANRATYFAPLAVGNVQSGGLAGSFKGAIAPAAAAGGLLKAAGPGGLVG
jgi:hypothetical protein